MRDERIVIYLSGGGYRAAIASIGALMAVIASGRWENVRKIVSVSGGGLPNAWLATRRPADGPEALRALDELLALLLDRRRSVRQMWVTAIACTSAVALLTLLGFVLFTHLGALFWAYLAVSGVLLFGVLGWLAPRVFLALDYRHYRGRFGQLRGAGWFREHVFVASDLWSARYAAFIGHADMSLIAAPPMEPLDASRVDFRTALRASTALPPVLPAVRIGVDSAPSSDRAYGSDRRAASSPRSLWLVDGGITGNLGTQSDPGITGASTRFDDLLAATRAVGEAFGGLARDAQEIEESAARGAAVGENLRRSAHIQAVGIRMSSDRATLKALSEARSQVGSLSDAVHQADAQNAVPGRADLVSHAIIRREAAALRLALNSPQLAKFEISHDEREALDEPVAPPPARRVSRAVPPECGHRPDSWSSCTECATTNVVVDASGKPAEAGRKVRILLWIPGLATVVNAVRTLHVLYQENLQEDRKVAQSFIVPVVQANDLYLREARLSSSRNPSQKGARWTLADTLLPGPLRASMPEEAFVRAHLREEAARLKTTLTAPPEKKANLAHAALASGYVGTRDLFAPGLSLDELDAELRSMDHASARAIRELVESTREMHRVEHIKAGSLRLAWVLTLRARFAEFRRAEPGLK